MADIDDIIRKEKTYVQQMAGVREKVIRSAELRGWEPMSRGRRAHISVYGTVNGLHGVIDIEMKETDWDKMPDSLQPDTPFTLSCGAYMEAEEGRRFADTELHWAAPFGELPETVERFLPEAWAMLTGLTEDSLLEEWPGPATDPDVGPDFGPPRRRG